MASIMEGPLSKWTNLMKGWQYRWFVLDYNAGLLSYYTVNMEGGAALEYKRSAQCVCVCIVFVCVGGAEAARQAARLVEIGDGGGAFWERACPTGKPMGIGEILLVSNEELSLEDLYERSVRES